MLKEILKWTIKETSASPFLFRSMKQFSVRFPLREALFATVGWQEGWGGRRMNSSGMLHLEGKLLLTSAISSHCLRVQPQQKIKRRIFKEIEEFKLLCRDYIRDEIIAWRLSELFHLLDGSFCMSIKVKVQSSPLSGEILICTMLAWRWEKSHKFHFLLLRSSRVRDGKWKSFGDQKEFSPLRLPPHFPPQQNYFFSLPFHFDLFDEESLNSVARPRRFNRTRRLIEKKCFCSIFTAPEFSDSDRVKSRSTARAWTAREFN